jgi:hypothetical protein
MSPINLGVGVTAPQWQEAVNTNLTQLLLASILVSGGVKATAVSGRKLAVATYVHSST